MLFSEKNEREGNSLSKDKAETFFGKMERQRERSGRIVRVKERGTRRGERVNVNAIQQGFANDTVLLMPRNCS